MGVCYFLNHGVAWLRNQLLGNHSGGRLSLPYLLGSFWLTYKLTLEGWTRQANGLIQESSFYALRLPKAIQQTSQNRACYNSLVQIFHLDPCLTHLNIVPGVNYTLREKLHAAAPATDRQVGEGIEWRQP